MADGRVVRQRQRKRKNARTRRKPRRSVSQVSFFGVMAGEADGVGDVVEFLGGDFSELFAFGGELFVDLDGLLGHLLVGVLCAAGEKKIRASSDPFVAVGIEPDAQENRFS